MVHDELLNRSYPRFELPAGETRALVTRLSRSAAGVRRQLNLYFASGMELQLGRLSRPFSHLIDTFYLSVAS